MSLLPLFHTMHLQHALPPRAATISSLELVNALGLVNKRVPMV